jgi:hypothetical protein
VGVYVDDLVITGSS